MINVINETEYGRISPSFLRPSARFHFFQKFGKFAKFSLISIHVAFIFSKQRVGIIASCRGFFFCILLLSILHIACVLHSTVSRICSIFKNSARFSVGAMTKKSRKSRAKKAPPSGVKSPLNEREDCPSPEIDPLWEIPPDAVSPFFSIPIEKQIQIKLGYPSENMCLTDLEGTLKEIEKQLTDVMEDRYITCDFPIKKTSSISMVHFWHLV